MLKDKVAMVTGAAQGIGYAIGEEFAIQGANVVLTDYNPSVIDAAKELNKNMMVKLLAWF